MAQSFQKAQSPQNKNLEMGLATLSSMAIHTHSTCR